MTPERLPGLHDAELVDVIRARVAAQRATIGGIARAARPARRPLRRASSRACSSASRWLFASAARDRLVERQPQRRRLRPSAGRRAGRAPATRRSAPAQRSSQDRNASCAGSSGRCRSRAAISVDEHVLERRRHGADARDAAARRARSAVVDRARRRRRRRAVERARARARRTSARRATPGSAASMSSGGARLSADHLEQLPGEPRCRRRRRVEREQPALVQQRHARAALGLVEVRRRHHDRDALRRGTPTAASRTRGATPDRRRSSARRAAISCGSCTSVQASASFCFMPPDSRSARRRAERRQLRHLEQPIARAPGSRARRGSRRRTRCSRRCVRSPYRLNRCDR